MKTDLKPKKIKFGKIIKFDGLTIFFWTIEKLIVINVYQIYAVKVKWNALFVPLINITAVWIQRV